MGRSLSIRVASVTSSPRHRDVEIGANENALSGNIGGCNAFKGIEQLGCHIFLPNGAVDRRAYFWFKLGAQKRPFRPPCISAAVTLT